MHPVESAPKKIIFFVFACAEFDHIVWVFLYNLWGINKHAYGPYIYSMYTIQTDCDDSNDNIWSNIFIMSSFWVSDRKIYLNVEGHPEKKFSKVVSIYLEEYVKCHTDHFVYHSGSNAFNFYLFS